MNRHWSLLPAVLLGLVHLLVTAPNLWAAIPFSQRKIIIEINGTAGDGGIQISLDGEGWKELEVLDPQGREVFEVEGSGNVGTTGVTELFFESAEPSFEDLPLDQLLARFPEGRYTFRGRTVGGESLFGRAPLKHNIPASPSVLTPAEGSVVNPNLPVVVDWNPVTAPFPGTTKPIIIGGYQVIVERVNPQPLLAFSVFLPSTVTQVTVPAEYIEGNAEYKFEVLAIEKSGNQTITESSFTTSAELGAASREMVEPDDSLADSEDQSDEEELDVARVGFLRPNQPNPFNPSTTIAFGLPREGEAALKVYDLSGRLVRTLVNGRLPAGEHRVVWDGRDENGHPAESGVYFTTLSGPDVSVSRKIVLTR